MKRLGPWLVLSTLLLGVGSARAASLQDIIQSAQRSVVHLSIVDAAGEELASGTGFVISEGGRLVTNFHVVDKAERAVAVFDGGRKVNISGALAFDAEADLAIVQLADGEYDHLTIADRAAQQGEEVVVVGSPYGFAGSASTGIVSAVREKGAVREGQTDGHENWMLQISAPIAPGSSGSPILDDEGQVIGVAVGTYGQALSFGIPASALAPLAKRAASASLLPLSSVRSGRTVTENLLISAAVLAGMALVGFAIRLAMRLKEKRRREGQAILDTVLRK